MKLAVTLPNKTLIDPLIEAGADIFILGVENFAQRINKAYDITTLQTLTQYIKDKNKTIYLSLNALIHEPDLPKLKSTIESLQSLPIDGILFADLAVYNIVEDTLLKDKLIYYPETYVTTDYDCNFWLNQGIKSVVIGREMTLESVKKMYDNTTLPLSIIGHGHLNMFHSKRPLIENFFKYTKDQNPKEHLNKKQLTLIEEKRDDHYPIIQDDFGTHIFRALPSASFSVLNTLKTTIDTFIIDGFFFTDDSLVDIVKDYKDALNGKDLTEKYAETTDTGFFFISTKTNKGESK